MSSQASRHDKTGENSRPTNGEDSPPAHRYLHHKALNPRPLAGCVPSIRRWKLAGLPTYLSAVQVQTALDGCDRTTVMGGPARRSTPQRAKIASPSFAWLSGR